MSQVLCGRSARVKERVKEKGRSVSCADILANTSPMTRMSMGGRGDIQVYIQCWIQKVPKYIIAKDGLFIE